MKNKTVTIIDVAKEAQVSTATVSNVLNRKKQIPMSEETIRKVEKAAERLGYRRNAMAAGLSRRQSRELGLLLPSFGGYFGKFAEVIERAAHDNGYRLSVFSSGHVPEIEKRHLESLMERRVDGLICHGLAMSYDTTRAIVSDGTPMVLFSAWGWPIDIAVCAVNLDFQQACAAAAVHLHDRGCRWIGYIGISPSNATNEQRKIGFTQGIEQRKGKVHSACLEIRTDEDYDLIADQLVHMTKSLFPIGILAFDDSVAFRLMTKLLKRGCKIPEQVKIIGINDSELARHSFPEMTSISIPYVQQSKLVLERLLHAIHGQDAISENSAASSPSPKEQEVRIPVHLVQRESTE